jgi:hypothetical protein
MSITLTETSAFEAFRPVRDEIEAHYVKRVRAAFTRWEELNEGRGFRHYRYSDTSPEARAYKACSRYVRSADSYSMRTGAALKLSEEFLAKEAAQFADDAVTGFVAKLIGKIGNIEMTNLRFRGNGEFSIDAHANGHSIRVDQQVVYKVSNRDTLFCQWPARIYVDGQFTPATKFDAAIAA